MTETLTGPKYYGGKTMHSAWINSYLPHQIGAYVEPYAGMLAVLLARLPAKIEIVNDLDQRVVVWWRAVRDRPDELERWLARTPYSRTAYSEALKVCRDSASFRSLAEEDMVAAAGHMAVILQQGYMALAPSYRDFGWRASSPCYRSRTNGWVGLSDGMRDLAARMQGVEVENQDALWLIKRWLPVEDVLLYLDPPYADGGQHYSQGPEHEPVLDLLRASDDVQAMVAISGYSDCAWAALEEAGWRREERATGFSIGKGDRTECLWLNFPPQERHLEQQCLLVEGGS